MIPIINIIFFMIQRWARKTPKTNLILNKIKKGNISAPRFINYASSIISLCICSFASTHASYGRFVLRELHRLHDTTKLSISVLLKKYGVTSLYRHWLLKNCRFRTITSVLFQVGQPNLTIYCIVIHEWNLIDLLCNLLLQMFLQKHTQHFSLFVRLHRILLK